MNLNIMDSHVHTTFSHDGENEMEEMCNKAINIGMEYITFTEHVDFIPIDDAYDYLKIDEYFNNIQRLNNKFGDNLEIFAGVEFSEPHLYTEQLKKYNNLDFDLIMGSIHYIGDNFVGNDGLLTEYSIDEIFLKYYNLLFKTVKNNNIDVVAHMDFPKRYLNYEYKNYKLIDKILKEIIKNGIVLEINSSSLRKGISTPMPSQWILERYIQYGGKRVTLGSDSHSINELTNDFDMIYQLIENLNLVPGYFKKGKFIKLE